MPRNSLFIACVKANTNVQSVVNIFITINIFQHRYVYSESVLNSWYVYDNNKTNKQALAGWKNNVDFKISSNKSPQFYFFWIKITLPYSWYFCLKNVITLFATIFFNLCHKASNFVKLFLKGKIRKNCGNFLEISPLGRNTP